MFQEQVYDYLSALSDGVLVSKNLRVFGIGESMVETKLGGELLNAANPTTALYAKEGQVLVRVTARASDQEEAERLVQPVVQRIKEILGTAVYGEDVNSLEEVVVAMLRAQHKTIATAESCTGGLLASAITSIPGSSEVFEFGAVTYANRIKHAVLGVPNRVIEQHGAVSEETAVAMAKGILKQSGADIGVAITGIAGPGGGTELKPVGTVYIAVASKLGESNVVRYSLARGKADERGAIRRLSVMNALNMVRIMLL
jgi:nicotinamide-nucleotide amidase